MALNVRSSYRKLKHRRSENKHDKSALRFYVGRRNLLIENWVVTAKSTWWTLCKCSPANLIRKKNGFLLISSTSDTRTLHTSFTFASFSFPVHIGKSPPSTFCRRCWAHHHHHHQHSISFTALFYHWIQRFRSFLIILIMPALPMQYACIDTIEISK